MNHRRHIISGLFATMISSCVLATTGTVADSHRFLVSENHEGSNHPELSLPTEFWRSEFLHNIERPERLDPSEVGDQHPGVPAATMQNSVPGFIVSSLEEELLQQHTPTDSETAVTATDVDVSKSHATSTEWDQAACSAIGPQGDKTTHDGPSVITAIVGVVGIVVVFGAYFSSTRNA